MKQLLKEIIKTWQTEPLPSIKPREVDLSKLFSPEIKKIISVIGFRRTGKTFSLFNLAHSRGKDRCVYINFEDERLPLTTELLTNLIEVLKELKGSQPLVLLLDEIQEVPNWSVWARRVNETTPYHFVISGSSSKLGSNEIPTELRGQTLSVQMFPLSWREFLNFKGLDIQLLPLPQILNAMREYLFFGGLPEIVLAGEGIKPLLLTEYYNTFVLRDVIERHKLRNTEALRDLLRIMLNTRNYTYGKISNTLRSLGHDVGKATVIRYLKWLESSFFITSAELCSPSVKKRIQAVRKAYTVDTYFSARFSSIFSQNLGHLMEQAVWQELTRRRANDPTTEIAYWKDYAQHEVDFVVIRHQNTDEIIQTTYASTLTEVADRETRSLLKAAKVLHPSKLTIITWELEQTAQVQGHAIEYIPLWKWLLHP